MVERLGVGWPKSVYRFLGVLLALGGLALCVYALAKALDMTTLFAGLRFAEMAPLLWALIVMIFCLGVGTLGFGAYMVAAGAPQTGLIDAVAVDQYSDRRAAGLPDASASDEAARAGAERLEAYPAAPDDLPTTRDAIRQVALARGEPEVGLWRLPEGCLNAIHWRDEGEARVAVTDAFADLPAAEQRAGIAMLVGRRGYEGELTGVWSYMDWLRKRRGRSLSDPRALEVNSSIRQWLGAVSAGDRGALLATRDPDGVLALLRRVQGDLTVLPIEDRTWDTTPVGYRCLAWPFAKDAPEDANPDRERIGLLGEVLPATWRIEESEQ